MIILTGKVFYFVSFSLLTLFMLWHYILACKLSAEKSDSFLGFLLYVTICFSLGVFKKFSLYFWYFNYSVCWCSFLLVHFIWNSLYSLDLDFTFFPRFGKFSVIIYSVKFSDLFFFSSSRTHIMQILFHVILSQRSLIFIFKIFFSFWCSVWVSFMTLSSSSLICICTSSCLLLNPSSVFFSSIFVFFSSDFCLVLSCVSFLFVKVFSVFTHSWSEFSEDIYDHYFELFIRYVTYLHIIRSFSETFVLFFCLEHISVSSFGFLYLFLCIGWKSISPSPEGVAFFWNILFFLPILLAFLCLSLWYMWNSCFSLTWEEWS